MTPTDLVNRIRSAFLLTDDLNPIEFTLDGSKQTPEGDLAITGLILIPHKGRMMNFGILIKNTWTNEDRAQCFVGLMVHAKSKVEEALKSGVLDEPAEEKPSLKLTPAILGPDGTPLHLNGAMHPDRLTDKPRLKISE